MKPFDRVYRHYDAFMKLCGLYKTDDILSVLKLNGDEMILDIGGGTGYLANKLSKHCNNIYILDESEKMMSVVTPNDNITTIVGDACHTNFNNNTFDVVILADVLHHIKDQNLLISEVHRLLKSSGKLLILDFDKNHLMTKILISFEYLLFGHLFFKNLKETRQLLLEKFTMHDEINMGWYFILTGVKHDKIN